MGTRTRLYVTLYVHWLSCYTATLGWGGGCVCNSHVTFSTKRIEWMTQPRRGWRAITTVHTVWRSRPRRYPRHRCHLLLQPPSTHVRLPIPGEEEAWDVMICTRQLRWGWRRVYIIVIIKPTRCTNRWPDSSVGIATELQANVPGSNVGGDEVFRPSRPALRHTQPPVKWVPGLSLG